MKKSYLALLFIVGCSALQQPTPNIRGCTSYCYPESTLTNLLLSLIVSNPVTHTTATWHGGIIPWDNGDQAEAIYNPLACSNQPQPAITFVWYCSNELHQITKNLPANAQSMQWDLSCNCSNCNWGVTNGYAVACDNVPESPMLGVWDYAKGAKGQVVTIKTKVRYGARPPR